jgi:hypothetical protein
MIRSSADILSALQASAIVGGSASSIVVVDRKPMASGREGFFVYIERYPTAEEFEVVWRVWIESDGSEPDDLILAEMKRLLPGFSFKLGLLIEATVREFKTAETEFKPAPKEAPAIMPPSGWLEGLEKRVQDLVEDVQDRMLLVGPGRAGKDGRDGLDGRPGAPGRDGRDGKDLLATDAMLDDLQDVTIQNRIPLQRGQVLTYNGVTWENLFIPQVQSITTGGGSDTTVVTGQQGSTISWIYHEETGEPHARKFHTHGETDATLVTELHVSKTNSAGNDVELLISYS